MVIQILSLTVNESIEFSQSTICPGSPHELQNAERPSAERIIPAVRWTSEKRQGPVVKETLISIHLDY